MLSVVGAGEIALYVEDMERSARFYEDILGLRRIACGPRLIALRIADDQVLLLFKRGASLQPSVTPEGVIPPHDASGHQHLAFTVKASDLEGWETKLKASGTMIESRVNWESGSRSLYFRDPDQHAIELVTPGAWPP